MLPHFYNWYIQAQGGGAGVFSTKNYLCKPPGDSFERQSWRKNITTIYNESVYDGDDDSNRSWIFLTHCHCLSDPFKFMKNLEVIATVSACM